MVLKKKKKNQKSDNNNAGVGQDKISNLPDELIHHILSFLPTKCVMATCILSKRWKCVSNSTPILDFRNWQTAKVYGFSKKPETERFMNFLDTVLFLHEKPKIQKFYLHLDKVADESRLNKWISTIVKRKVENFRLHIRRHPSASFIFPASFFTCDSLTLLDLRFNTTSICKLIIPDKIYFPKLKTLRLGSLGFVDETSTRKFFSNCPNLKELIMCACRISGGLCIVNSTLKHLSVICCFMSNSTVNISAPNLLTISYRGEPPTDFVLNTFPSLGEADISFHLDEEEEYEYQKETFVKLFKKLSKAKLLKIYSDSFLVLSEADIPLTNFPSFDNLIHLEVGSYSDSWSNGTARRFFKFLQLSPSLESIVLSLRIPIPEEEVDGYRSLDPNKSLLPHLKSIKFKKFDGGPMELNAVKLFLKYAQCLKTVTIVASPRLSLNHEEQLNVTNLLHLLPKPADCVVKFDEL